MRLIIPEGYKSLITLKETEKLADLALSFSSMVTAWR